MPVPRVLLARNIAETPKMTEPTVSSRILRAIGYHVAGDWSGASALPGTARISRALGPAPE